MLSQWGRMCFLFAGCLLQWFQYWCFSLYEKGLNLYQIYWFILVMNNCYQTKDWCFSCRYGFLWRSVTWRFRNCFGYVFCLVVRRSFFASFVHTAKRKNSNFLDDFFLSLTSDSNCLYNRYGQYNIFWSSPHIEKRIKLEMISFILLLWQCELLLIMWTRGFIVPTPLGGGGGDCILNWVFCPDNFNRSIYSSYRVVSGINKKPLQRRIRN